MNITIPTSWSDVTLRQYQRIAEIPSLKFEDELDKQIKVLSILTGIVDDYFLSVPFSELGKLLSKVGFIYSLPKQSEIKSKINIKGNRYRVNLLPSNLVAGEYIDLTNLLKDKDKIADNLPDIMAIFLKPVNIFGLKKKGCYKEVEGAMVQTLDSRDKTKELILDGLTMDYVFPISGFFLNLWESLMRVTQDYSGKQLEKAMKKINKQVEEMDLPKSTGGTLR